MLQMAKNIFYEIDFVKRTAFLIAFLSLISQLMALMRDRIFASEFGPSRILDIYYAAFNVPDLIYAILFSLISSVTLVPIFSKVLEKENGNWQKVYRVFSTFLNMFLIFIIPISVIIYFFMPEIINLSLPGFNAIDKEQVISLSRIILLQPVFLGLSALVSSLAQTENKFLAFSLAPIVYNLGIMLGTIYFYPIFGISGLGYGVVLGAMLHLIIQSLSLLKAWHHTRFSYTTEIIWLEVWDLLKLSFWRVLSFIVNNIRMIAMIFFASSFGTGAISYFKITSNLAEIFFSLITISYTVAAFPVLSRFFEEKKEREFENLVVKSLNYLFFWCTPVIAYVIIMRAHIIRIVLGTGVIDWEKTKILAVFLAILILVLVLQSLVYFLGRVCYAQRNTFLPFISQAIATLVMIIFIYVINKFLPHLYSNYLDKFNIIFNILKIPEINTLEKVQLFILPIGFIFFRILEFIIMLFCMQVKKLFDFRKIFWLKKTIRDTIYSSTILFIAIYFFLRIFESFLNVNIGDNQTLPGLLLQTFLTSVFGFLIWYGVLRFLRNEEIVSFEEHIREKMWKKKILSDINLGEI